jgi:hypothetical protein
VRSSASGAAGFFFDEVEVCADEGRFGRASGKKSCRESTGSSN